MSFYVDLETFRHQQAESEAEPLLSTVDIAVEKYLGARFQSDTPLAHAHNTTAIA